MPIQPMLNIALRAAREAGKIIARASGRLDTLKIIQKDRNDFATNIDQEAERTIIHYLAKAYPNHAFLGEENGQQGNPNSEYQWIIDPLDGTTNFIHGIPHFAISIACQHRGELTHAVIVDPMLHEEFTASRGQGAQLNGRRLRVSSFSHLNGGTLVGTGIPFKSRNERHIAAYMQSLEAIARQTGGIRRAGAASLDLAYVAAGRLDAFWEIALKPWDIAAGVLLVQEAGGLISDFKGQNHYMDNGNIVAGNPKCFKSTLQAIQLSLGDI